MNEAPTKPAGRLFGGPPAYEPRTPWRAGAAVAASVAIVGLAFLAALVPRYLRLDSGATAVPNPVQPEIPASSLWVVAIFQVVAVALTLLASVAFGGRLRDVLALRKAPGGWRAYAGGILAMVALQAVVAVATFSLVEHDVLSDLRPFVGLVSGPYWPLAAAVLAIGAPLSEELLFRGFLLGAMAQSLESGLGTLAVFLFRTSPGPLARRRLGFWTAAVASSGAWTALHAGYSLVGLAEVFVIGMLLSWLLWRTGSLWVTIFCHGLYNLVVALALRLVDVQA